MKPEPFHPEASHIDPGYRDGWNAAIKAMGNAQDDLQMLIRVAKEVEEQAVSSRRGVGQALLRMMAVVGEIERDAEEAMSALSDPVESSSQTLPLSLTAHPIPAAPAEPTERMGRAGVAAGAKSTFAADMIYRAMIAAAPKAVEALTLAALNLDIDGDDPLADELGAIWEAAMDASDKCMHPAMQGFSEWCSRTQAACTVLIQHLPELHAKAAARAAVETSGSDGKEQADKVKFDDNGYPTTEVLISLRSALSILPGGDICSPQQVADDLRALAAGRKP